MSSLLRSRGFPDDALANKPTEHVPEAPEPEAPRPRHDFEDSEVVDVGPDPASVRNQIDTLTATDRPPAPSLLPDLPPSLQRMQQNQRPPDLQNPTPAGPPAPFSHQQQAPGSQPSDSLTLAQLRRLVAEPAPMIEPALYAYEYADTAPMEQEIDEWWSTHNFWQWVRLNSAHRGFRIQWATANADKVTLGDRIPDDAPPWEEVELDRRAEFVRRTVAMLRTSEGPPRNEALGALVYLVLGRWADTVAGQTLPSTTDAKVKSAATEPQLQAIKDGVKLVAKCDGVAIVWDAMRKAFEPFWNRDPQQTRQNIQSNLDVLQNLMSIIYIMMQACLDDVDGMALVREKLIALDPSLLEFLLEATARLRWEEQIVLPQTQIFLLFWKSILLVLGGTKELKAAKEALDESPRNKKDMITASPLDYHTFRLEITSKYPAYIPPQPVLPLEDDCTTLLPQPLDRATRNSVSNGILSMPCQSGGASILHQPVHIATPSPSPPPSPGVGGKGGKKQNYQTNQNFPFMYPPLDATSNSAGGKGEAGMMEHLVSRKWEGSDVPASILEAGELFAARVKMTRATRQLWEERERFLKCERGYGADVDVIDELDLSSLSIEEQKELGLIKPRADQKAAIKEHDIDYGPNGPDGLDVRVKERLEAIEKIYRAGLAQFQSLVIVLVRAIMFAGATWTPAGQMGPPQQPGPGLATHGRVNGGPGLTNGLNGAAKPESMPPTDEELEELRSREIAAKAVTGILILLLKWFKISHVLKYEFLTQLLLDNNYIQVVLKILGQHDMQQVVETNSDRIEHSFFYFCGSRAGAMQTPSEAAGTEIDEVSEDEAAPPPIRRRRSHSELTTEGEANSNSIGQPAPRKPEVDEFGYAISNTSPDDEPAPHITEYSARNFFSLINYLRVMQKMCKNKAHRNLLLVHYKSSPFLRKSLKAPQEQLRLYTLKLFKNQVPYCGRKWRQSNMRVITAVYLHCRPELRDEWLAGADVDADVEEALPLEQALRSLTHWFNVRHYPGRMAAAEPEGGDQTAAAREGRDFFARELERMDLQWAAAADSNMDASARMEWDSSGVLW